MCQTDKEYGSQRIAVLPFSCIFGFGVPTEVFRDPLWQIPWKCVSEDEEHGLTITNTPVCLRPGSSQELSESLCDIARIARLQTEISPGTDGWMCVCVCVSFDGSLQVEPPFWGPPILTPRCLLIWDGRQQQPIGVERQKLSPKQLPPTTQQVRRLQLASLCSLVQGDSTF